MPHPVIWYSSTDAGAPTLNNAPGSLINVLDACLINGYNARSVTSLSVAAGVATATVSAHGFRSGQIVLVEGATPTALNGRQKVTVTGANTLTFPALGVPDGTATGTITMKAAPLGWEKRFSGTNKAVYARTAPEATAMVLRIDDTGASPAASTYARALMYEAMSDVDTGVGLSPTSSQLTGGQYWAKGANNTSAKHWMLVGDDLTFYFFAESSQASFSIYGHLSAHGFGDLISYRAGDAYGCFLGGPSNTSMGSSFLNRMLTLSAFDSSASEVLARPNNQIGNAVYAGMLGYASNYPPGSYGPVYPSPVDNGMVISSPTFCVENSSSFSHPIRGEYPGLAIPLAAVRNVMHGSVLSNVIGSSDEFLAVAVAPSSGPTNPSGCVLFNISSAWR